MGFEPIREIFLVLGSRHARYTHTMYKTNAIKIPLQALALVASFAIARADANATYYGSFSPDQCVENPITPGDDEDRGEGLIRYCGKGRNQMIYVSGEINDSEKGESRDEKSLNEIIKKLKPQKDGTIQVLTYNAGGGCVDCHQELMMAIEKACQKKCRIETTVMGSCVSACNQLHLTCAKGSTTQIAVGGQMLEHASQGDRQAGCNRCDLDRPMPAPASGVALTKYLKEWCSICPREEAIREYTMRCGESLRRQGVQMDDAKKAQVKSHAEKMAADGVFDKDDTSIVNPPWAKRLKPSEGPAPSGATNR
ncbi:MAG: hypothetical protein AB7F86_01420 [Bdellovibrionales bacterium]